MYLLHNKHSLKEISIDYKSKRQSVSINISDGSWQLVAKKTRKWTRDRDEERDRFAWTQSIGVDLVNDFVSCFSSTVLSYVYVSSSLSRSFHLDLAKSWSLVVTLRRLIALPFYFSSIVLSHQFLSKKFETDFDVEKMKKNLLKWYSAGQQQH